MRARSMTGFGRGRAQRRGVRVDVEVSSVNRRQLDLQMHLPRELQVLESRIQDEIARHVQRGRVTMSAEVTLTDGARPTVRLCEPLAAAYVAAFRRLARRLNLPADLDLRTLLSLPELWVVEQPDRAPDRLWPVLRTAVRRAIRNLVAMRETEGRVLCVDIARRATTLERFLAAIRRRVPGAVRQRRAALLRRLKFLAPATASGRQDMARELMAAVERMDIAEELTRLSGHLAQLRRTLRSTGPCGRSLEFLTQELLREANTVAAKSIDGRIIELIVEFKAELERMREQIQNIE